MPELTGPTITGNWPNAPLPKARLSIADKLYFAALGAAGGLILGLMASDASYSNGFDQGRRVGRHESAGEFAVQQTEAIQRHWHAAHEPYGPIIPPPYTTREVLDRAIQAERHGAD